MSWFWLAPVAVTVVGAIAVLIRSAGALDEMRAVLNSTEEFRSFRAELALLRVERNDLADRLRELRRQ